MTTTCGSGSRSRHSAWTCWRRRKTHHPYRGDPPVRRRVMRFWRERYEAVVLDLPTCARRRTAASRRSRFHSAGDHQRTGGFAGDAPQPTLSGCRRRRPRQTPPYPEPPYAGDRLQARGSKTALAMQPTRFFPTTMPPSRRHYSMASRCAGVAVRRQRAGAVPATVAQDRPERKNASWLTSLLHRK